MTHSQPALSRDDLDELGDEASVAAAEQLVAAAAAGRLSDPADTGYAYLLAAGIHEDADELTEALSLAERAITAYQRAGSGQAGSDRAGSDRAGPEPAGLPRAVRARLLLQLGRTGEAMAELGALRPLMVSDPRAAAYVPEALAAGGRTDTALEWLAEALDALEPGQADQPVTAQLLAVRDRIRGGAVEPDDEPDDEDGDGDGDRDRDGDGDGVDAGPDRRAGDPYDLPAVLLVWPEEAYEQVDQRWPEVLESTGAESWDGYREYCQAFITEWVQRSRTPLLAVAGDAAEFEEWLAEQGADPYYSNLVALAREYGDHLASQADPVELPPEPDSPCWCGSGVNYADCCRRLSPKR